MEVIYECKKCDTDGSAPEGAPAPKCPSCGKPMTKVETKAD